MNERQPIRVEIDGITYLSAGHYYEGINRWASHKIKEGDEEVCKYAARQMSRFLPSNAIIVPIPNHKGVPIQTMQLAKSLSAFTGVPVLDALRGCEHEPQYEAKYKGRPLTDKQFGFHRIASIPRGKIPFLIDNVVDTGSTSKAAYQALGIKGVVLSFAMSDTLLQPALKETTSIRR